MISQFMQRFKTSSSDLFTSRLYNEQTFYRAFERDLGICRSEAIIESPFLTTRRVTSLQPLLQKALRRGVKITVNTRAPQEHDDYMRLEAMMSINTLQKLGIEVLLTGGQHRKLVILDRKVLWEGSLNVLSQSDSCEVMRRIESETLANQMIGFVGLNKFL